MPTPEQEATSKAIADYVRSAQFQGLEAVEQLGAAVNVMGQMRPEFTQLPSDEQTSLAHKVIQRYQPTTGQKLVSFTPVLGGMTEAVKNEEGVPAGVRQILPESVIKSPTARALVAGAFDALLLYGGYKLAGPLVDKAFRGAGIATVGGVQGQVATALAGRTGASAADQAVKQSAMTALRARVTQEAARDFSAGAFESVARDVADERLPSLEQALGVGAVSTAFGLGFMGAGRAVQKWGVSRVQVAAQLASENQAIGGMVRDAQGMTGAYASAFRVGNEEAGELLFATLRGEADDVTAASVRDLLVSQPELLGSELGVTLAHQVRAKLPPDIHSVKGARTLDVTVEDKRTRRPTRYAAMTEEQFAREVEPLLADGKATIASAEGSPELIQRIDQYVPKFRPFRVADPELTLPQLPTPKAGEPSQVEKLVQQSLLMEAPIPGRIPKGAKAAEFQQARQQSLAVHEARRAQEGARESVVAAAEREAAAHRRTSVLEGAMRSKIAAQVTLGRTLTEDARRRLVDTVHGTFPEAGRRAAVVGAKRITAERRAVQRTIEGELASLPQDIRAARHREYVTQVTSDQAWRQFVDTLQKTEPILAPARELRSVVGRAAEILGEPIRSGGTRPDLPFARRLEGIRIGDTVRATNGTDTIVLSKAHPKGWLVEFPNGKRAAVTPKIGPDGSPVMDAIEVLDRSDAPRFFVPRELAESITAGRELLRDSKGRLYSVKPKSNGLVDVVRNDGARFEALADDIVETVRDGGLQIRRTDPATPIADLAHQARIARIAMQKAQGPVRARQREVFDAAWLSIQHRLGRGHEGVSGDYGRIGPILDQLAGQRAATLGDFTRAKPIDANDLVAVQARAIGAEARMTPDGSVLVKHQGDIITRHRGRVAADAALSRLGRRISAADRYFHTVKEATDRGMLPAVTVADAVPTRPAEFNPRVEEHVEAATQARRTVPRVEGASKRAGFGARGEVRKKVEGSKGQRRQAPVKTVDVREVKRRRDRQRGEVTVARGGGSGGGIQGIGRADASGDPGQFINGSPLPFASDYMEPVTVMTRLGPAGRELAETVLRKNEFEEQLRGALIVRLNKILEPLTAEEIETSLERVMIGAEMPRRAEVDVAARKLKEILDEQTAMARSLGLEDIDDIAFPHIYNVKELRELRGDGLREFYDRMIEAGDAVDYESAADRLTSWLDRNGSRYSGNFGQDRLHAFGYVTNARHAMATSIVRNAKRLAEIKHYGMSEGVVTKALKRIDDQSGSAAAQYVHGVMDYEMGRERVPMHGLSGMLYDVALLRLSLSGIWNLQQNVNTVAKTDMRAWIQAAGDVGVPYTKKWYDAVERAKHGGALNDDIMHEWRTGGLSGPIDFAIGAIEQRSKIRSKTESAATWSLRFTEEWNRAIAFRAGEIWFDRMIKLARTGDEFAQRELQYWRFSPDEILNVKNSELGAARTLFAKRVSDATQFSARAINTPQAVRSTVGRLVFQLKNFSMKQVGLITRDFDARHRGGMRRGMRTLGMLLASTPAFALGATYLRHYLTFGQEPVTLREWRALWDDPSASRAMSFWASSVVVGGTLGFMSDTFLSIATGNAYEARGFVAPVSGTGLMDMMQAGSSGIYGHFDEDEERTDRAIHRMGSLFGGAGAAATRASIGPRPGED